MNDNTLPETLNQKQQRFTRMVAQLITFAFNQPHYGLTLGEAFRTDEMADIYARLGKGVRHSIHCQRLAIDVNLFIDGVYQRETTAYQVLGEFWESIGGTWGGRFKDGNHFSLAHNGRK